MNEKMITDAGEVVARLKAENDRREEMNRVRPGISVPGVEAKKFSIVRLVKSLSRGGAFNASAREGAEYEFEVCRAAEKALARGTDSAGGFLIPEEALASEDLLRSQLVVQRAGVRVLANLQGSPVAIPRLSASATAAWEAENTEHTPTDQTFAEVSLTPKRATAGTRISNQLLRTNAGAAEQIVRNDLLALVDRIVEKGVIEGTGTSGQPTGLTNNASIGTGAAAGASGAQKLTAMTTALSTIEAANGDIARAAWVMHPSDYWDIASKQIEPYSGANPSGLMLGAIVGVQSRTLLGLPVFTTTNMTAGSVLVGDFAQCVLGMWGGLEIVVTGEGKTLALADQTLVVVRKYVDVGVINPGALYEITGM